jgi:uncharacterized protein
MKALSNAIIPEFSDKGKIGIFTQTFAMVNIHQKDRPKGGIYSNYRKSKGKPALFIGVFLLVILLMAVLYNPARESRKMNNGIPAATASSEPQFVRHGELTFMAADSTEITRIEIEIADDDFKREKGLMYRRQMRLDHGMLFIFEDEDLRSFWMKNTYLPLDIIYLDAKRRIVRIHENVATLNERPIPSEFPARYVVEVNAGFTALYGLKTGSWMTFVRN